MTIRRIIPASFAVLALTTLASLLFLPPSTRPGALQDAIATASYVPNVVFAVQGADYLSLVVLNSGTVFPGWAALLPVLSTAAVIVCGSASPAGGAGRVLGFRPLQKIGAWSYSIYLVHWPLLIIPQAAVHYENPLPLFVTLILGALSTPIATTRDSAAQPLRVSPTGSTFVPANLMPTLRDAPGSVPAIYEDGCHADFPATVVQTDCVYRDNSAEREIVLFGDSHAAQWFPAVEAYAAANSYRLPNLTKSSCPSVEIEILREESPYSECEEWHQSALNYVNEVDPELVLLSNFGEVSPVAPSTGLLEQWETGLRSTLEALPESSRTVVLADTPSHDASPLDCLSQNTEEASRCDLERTEGVDEDIIALEKRATAQGNNSFHVDLNGYLCTDICPSIIGDLLVYRDEHHITTEFSRALAGPLGDELDKVQ